MPDLLLVAENVGFAFKDGRPILHDINLEIPQGSFVALVGPSGIGKSTLLRLLAGLLQPTGGVIHRPGNAQPEAIGIVFQKDNLMPWRTAVQNVRLPLEIRRQNPPDADQRLADIFTLVGLSGSEDSYPGQLSGGMAQRVAIARALIHEPALLLLDEPFGALDALTRERMGQELLRIRRARPVTVFMVTHSIQEAVFLADKVLVMGEQPARITQEIPVPLPRPRRLALQGARPFLETVQSVRQGIEALTG